LNSGIVTEGIICAWSSPQPEAAIAHAAFDAAVAQYGGERLTLRKGAMMQREHGKVELSSSLTRSHNV